MITFKGKGNFSDTNKFLEKMKTMTKIDILDKYGKAGVKALSASTPVSTGETADAWSYEIIRTKKGASVVWSNSHVVNGINIAIILQYGHGTKNGGWVEGRDYINSAMQSIFDEMAESAWKEVTRS